MFVFVGPPVRERFLYGLGIWEFSRIGEAELPPVDGFPDIGIRKRETGNGILWRYFLRAFREPCLPRFPIRVHRWSEDDRGGHVSPVIPSETLSVPSCPPLRCPEADKRIGELSGGLSDVAFCSWALSVHFLFVASFLRGTVDRTAGTVCICACLVTAGAVVGIFFVSPVSVLIFGCCWIFRWCPLVVVPHIVDVRYPFMGEDFLVYLVLLHLRSDVGIGDDRGGEVR